MKNTIITQLSHSLLQAKQITEEQLHQSFLEAKRQHISWIRVLLQETSVDPLYLMSQLAQTLRLSFDETRRALRKQCAVEEPAIGVGCWAKQATHHAVKSWWEARA